MSITDLGVAWHERAMPAHVAYVPVLDDEGTVHKAQIKCVCSQTEAHEHPAWDALLAEATEILDYGQGR